MEGEETGFFLSDFAQQLRRKNADVPDISFTLLDAAGISPTLILNQNAKAEERRSWSLSKSERQKLQMLYREGGVASWSVLSESWQSVSIKGETIFAFKTFLYKTSLLPHVNSSAWEYLLDSNMKFGVWTWYMMLN